MRFGRCEMKINQVNNVKFYSFENLETFEKQGTLKHAFSTRIGGVSDGVYSSMNLHFRNDKRENVIENYKRFCDAIDCNYQDVVFSNQIHEDKVYRVSKYDKGKGLLRESDIKGIDALITNEKDVLLTTFYADCVPIYLFDPVNKAIGLAHSGWKGTVKEIGVKTAYKMKEEFNTKFEDLIIGIAPSISLCCFQVDKNVYLEFKEKIPFSTKYIFEDLEKGKYKIDLQGIIKQGFINIGVLEENIEVANICTKCNPDTFFSHRAMGDERGSLAGVMCLK